MTLQELIAGWGGAIALVLTLVQIAPVRLNPWSALGRAVGRAVNSDVLRQLDELRRAQEESRRLLDSHILSSGEAAADTHRRRILAFNNELLRAIPHTREDFLDILAEINAYEAYCDGHPDYSNQRATHAIANIGRVYDERLQKRDFL